MMNEDLQSGIPTRLVEQHELWKHLNITGKMLLILELKGKGKKGQGKALVPIGRFASQQFWTGRSKEFWRGPLWTSTNGNKKSETRRKKESQTLKKGVRERERDKNCVQTAMRRQRRQLQMENFLVKKTVKMPQRTFYVCWDLVTTVLLPERTKRETGQACLRTW